MKEKYWFKWGKNFAGFMLVVSFIIYLTSSDLLFIFSPALYLAALDLGMRGSAPSGSEEFLVLTIATLITFIFYFIIGAILGWIYSKINNKLLFLRSICAVFIFIVVALIYWASEPNYNSISQCTNSLSRARLNFREDICYWSVARIKKDISICDHLPDNTGNFSKYDCYTVIASDTRNPKICEKIPPLDNFGPSRHLRDCIFYTQ